MCERKQKSTKRAELLLSESCLLEKYVGVGIRSVLIGKNVGDICRK